MAVIIPTNAVEIARFANGLFGLQLGFATSNQVAGDVSAYGGLNAAFNNYYTLAYGSATTASVAAAMAANLGITAANGVAAADITNATAYITAQLNAAPASARGAVVKSVLDMWASIDSDPVNGPKYTKAAATWNNQISAAVAYGGAINPDITVSAAALTVNQGSTVALTTGIDTLTGTANNDTFTASYDGGTTSTYGAADSINGNGGSDVLNINATADAVKTLPAALTTGIQTINIRNIDGDATAQILTVDGSLFSGATNINITNSNDSVTLSNLTSTEQVGIVGNTVITNGATVAGWAATVTAGTINVSGGTTAGAVTTSGTLLATNTINSSSVPNTSTGSAGTNTIGALTLGAAVTTLNVNAAANITTGTVTNTTAAAVKTITITGSGAVSFGTGAVPSTVTTIDASAATGGLTVVLPDSATVKVTGSSGNDVITANKILTTGSVDAGAGTDVLDVGTNASYVNTTALAAKYTNFEKIRINDTLDMSLFPAFTGIELSGASALTNLTPTMASSVVIRADSGASQLTLQDSSGTTDSLTLTAGRGTTSLAATNLTGTLTASGFETINFKANPGPSATPVANKTSTINSITDTALKTLVLTGTAVTISAAPSTTNPLTIDGSGLTGDGGTGTAQAGLVVSATNNLTVGSSVIGSSFADSVVVGNTFGNSYNLGAGNDAISSTVANLRSGVTYNTIDGGAGTDTLTISDGAAATVTMVDNDFKGLSNVEKLTVTSTTTGNISITSGGWFNSSFANGVTVTTTNTTGTLTLDLSTYSGNATISATEGTNGGATAITTGSGNDSITLVATGAAVGGITISGGAGNDTIVGSAQAQTIIGGSGNDTMTGGAGVDTYKFANTGDSGTPSANSFDTITNYVTTADIIDFTGALTTLTNATTAGAGVAAIGTNNKVTGFNAADTTLAQHIVAVEAALTKSTGAANTGTTPTALNYAVWAEGTDAYMFVTDGISGVTSGDTLIKLVGVLGTAGTVTTLTLSGGGDITAVA